ncbi:MAG TPA: LamG domain-containing protein [Candidatus Paceibacterota bacterium]|nr:LamG domain-containing protein [Candidatus Paceibacterota bacterium]
MAISLKHKIILASIIVYVAFAWANAAQAAIITPANNFGLLSYWKFDEGSGATARDYSGNGYNLDLYNSPTWTPGKIGSSLSFNSSSIQVASRGFTSAYNFGTGDFSVSFWIKPSSPWGTGATIGLIGQKSSDSDNGWQIYQDSGHPGHLDVRLTQQHNFLTTATIPTGVWTLATFVRTGGTIYWYVNGVLDSSSTDTANIIGAAPFYIGYAQTWGAYYNGSLDDIRIYNRALSAGEVANFYNATSVKYNTSAGTLAGGSTLKNGLVGWWTFDGSTIGTTIQDSSGQGNNGYVGGGVATSSMLVQGKLGQALSLSGSSYVNLGNILSFSGTAPFAVSAWVKTTATGAQTIVSKFNSGVTGQWILNLSSTNHLQLQRDCGSFTLTSNAVLSPGAWYHVVGVFDGTTKYLYINGTLDTSTVDACSTPTPTTNVLIGSEYVSNSPGNFFKGPIDDVRVYNRALSAGEVKQLYQEGAAKVANAITLSDNSSLASGLVAYWSLNGIDVTDKIYDRIGGYNGYADGSVATSSMKVAGKLGQALHFNGMGDYIRNTSVVSAISGNTQGSVSVWFRRTADTNGSLIYLGQSGTNNNIFRLLYTAGGTISLLLKGSSDFYRATATLAYDTKWHQLTFTVNSLGNTLYIDGSAVGLGYTSGSSSTSNWFSSIGSMDLWTDGYELISSPSSPFAGDIDEIRVYNRALSANEAKQLYNLGK